MHQPKDVDDLIAAIAHGARPRFVLFMSHRPPPERGSGEIGPECLSQWYPAPFEHAGVRYATAEHWMMAEKARLFGDDEVARAVVADDDPRAAKRLGRAVRGFDEARWTERRDEVVRRGNELKFAAHPPLADVLERTGDAVLVEASPRDRVWGIGRSAEDPGARDPSRWKGLNRLGFALMAVREQRRAATKASAKANAAGGPAGGGES